MKNLYPRMEFRSSTTLTKKSKLNSSVSSYLYLQVFPRNISRVLLMTYSIFFAGISMAQTGIKNFTSLNNAATTGKTYLGPGGGIGAQPEYIPSNNNTFTYNFGSTSGLQNGSVSVSGYTAGTSTFSVIPNTITSVVMRRVNNSVVTGDRDILFFAGNRTPGINVTNLNSAALTLNLNAPYVADMSTAFSQNNLLVGTDNIFSNQGNGNDNNNNIERVDAMIPAGFHVLDAHRYGFPILERGGYGGHDAYKIAVITAIDNDGNPSAYSNIVSVNSASYNNSNAANPIADGIYTYFLFKRVGANDLQVNQHTNNQGIGGIAYRFSDFGIADGATIYGYSILPNDFNGTVSSDVVDYTNATHYPTNTSETAGGLDLLAVLGLAIETTVLPMQISSFSVSEKTGHPTLEWTTVNELNNRGFQVQRSANGKDWSTIGFQPSLSPDGNSTQKLHYTYADNNPLKGVNYYRLVNYDLDNHARTSEIRILIMNGDHTDVIKTFPNPVTDNMYVQGMTPGTILKLIDARGVIVNRTTATSSVETIPADKLSPGIYFLQVIRNNVLVKTIQVAKM